MNDERAIVTADDLFGRIANLIEQNERNGSAGRTAKRTEKTLRNETKRNERLSHQNGQVGKPVQIVVGDFDAQRMIGERRRKFVGQRKSKLVAEVDRNAKPLKEEKASKEGKNAEIRRLTRRFCRM